MSVKDPKSFFDYPVKEKKRLINAAADEANKAQREFMDREICICAAIKINHTTIIRGHRHVDCFAAAYRAGWTRKVVIIAEQGFVTSKNRFVDRKRALQLQIAAGMKITDTSLKLGELYSEDLY